MTIWADALATLRPSRDARDGPFPPLLLILTVVTGLVDAASYLRFGRVFVANMTGNVVFLGFAIAGSAGLSALASLTALGAFLLGGIVGGRLATARPAHRGLLLRDAVAAEIVLVGAAVVLSALVGGRVHGHTRYGVIALLALAMGIQNAAARRLAVADLTTTVLTLTLTGIAAESQFAGGAGARNGRRLLAVTAMLVGALGGALMVIHLDDTAPLAAAMALLAIAALLIHLASRAPGEWARR